MVARMEELSCQLESRRVDARQQLSDHLILSPAPPLRFIEPRLRRIYNATEDGEYLSAYVCALSKTLCSQNLQSLRFYLPLARHRHLAASAVIRPCRACNRSSVPFFKANTSIIKPICPSEMRRTHGSFVCPCEACRRLVVDPLCILPSFPSHLSN